MIKLNKLQPQRLDISGVFCYNKHMKNKYKSLSADDYKLAEVKQFFKDNQIEYRHAKSSRDHFKIWNPFTDTWMNYYALSGTICDSFGSKIRKLPYRKLDRYTMKGKDVRY